MNGHQGFLISTHQIFSCGANWRICYTSLESKSNDNEGNVFSLLFCIATINSVFFFNSNNVIPIVLLSGKCLLQTKKNSKSWWYIENSVETAKLRWMFASITLHNVFQRLVNRLRTTGLVPPKHKSYPIIRPVRDEKAADVLAEVVVSPHNSIKRIQCEIF